MPLSKIGEKIIDLMSKLGGSKIYPENQVIIDCFMPSTRQKSFFFFFNFLIDIHLGKKAAISIGYGAKVMGLNFGPTGMRSFCKQLELMCLAQGHNAVMPVRLEPATPRATALPLYIMIHF